MSLSAESRLSGRRSSVAKSLLMGMVLSAGTLFLPAQTSAAKPVFHPGEIQLDTAGHPINAHWAGMLRYGGVYYWFGVAMAGETVQRHVPLLGVSCYSSRDLCHWKNEGIVLPAVKNDPSSDLAEGKYFERPKVIYNRRTRQFVMWMHVDFGGYKYARAGVAVSDSPAGPYRYLGSVRPDGAESRDTTLFEDKDGKAYLIFASEENHTMHVAQLTDDYLKFNGAFARVFVNQFREAPTVFRYGNRYFLITSHCSGWAHSAALYAVAPSMLGPWKEMTNPAVGPGSDTTFESQGADVLPVAGRHGAFIFLADRWNPHNLVDSRYVWLPIGVQGDKLEIQWRDPWDLSIFNKGGLSARR
jgi:beta-xylosidase